MNWGNLCYTLSLQATSNNTQANNSEASASNAKFSQPITDKVAFIRKVYNDYPHIKIFASSFGHQLVTIALGISP